MNPDQSRRSMQMTSLEFQGNTYEDGRTNVKTLLIPRIGDTFVPDIIHIRNPQQFALKSITFTIGGVDVLSFDSFFFNTFPERKQVRNRTIKYVLPKEDYKLDQIFRLIAIQHFEVKVLVSYTGMCDRMKLFCTYSFLNEQDRLAMY